MVLSGLIVLAFRRDKAHIAVWFALIAYWMAGGVIQDITGNNSIPWPNLGMAAAVGIVCATIGERTRTLWPAFVFAFMVLTVINDTWYGILTDFAMPTKVQRSFYQNACYVLFFLSLLSVCSPDLRRLYVRLGDAWGRIREKPSS
jgi:hypothetical protein